MRVTLGIAPGTRAGIFLGLLALLGGCAKAGQVALRMDPDTTAAVVLEGHAIDVYVRADTLHPIALDVSAEGSGLAEHHRIGGFAATLGGPTRLTLTNDTDASARVEINAKGYSRLVIAQSPSPRREESP
jgi:hypothetical protein